MKRLLVFACVAGMSAPAFCASDVEKLDSRINDSRTVIQEIMATPDKSIPDSITKKAVCIGVIPGVKKGAFIVGGEYGQGVVTCHTGHGWSGPVFIRLSGGSFGLQLGGQATDLVLVAVNDRASRLFCMTSSRSAETLRPRLAPWGAIPRPRPI